MRKEGFNLLDIYNYFCFDFSFGVGVVKLDDFFVFFFLESRVLFFIIYIEKILFLWIFLIVLDILLFFVDKVFLSVLIIIKGYKDIYWVFFLCNENYILEIKFLN